MAMIAFFIVGSIKGGVTGTGVVRSGIETAVIGFLAAVIAYIIGHVVHRAHS